MMMTILTGILASTTLGVGDAAPDFEAVDIDGKRQVLAEMVKRGTVVLAFFPKAFTPGWTKEVQAYQAGRAEFSDLKAQVLAISADKPDTLKKFRAKYGKDVHFVSDPEGELIKRYGVKTPVITLAQRTTFVIDQAGVIRAIQTGGDAIDVSNALKSVKELKSGAEPK